MHGHGHFPIAFAQRLLQRHEHFEIALEPGQLALELKRLAQAAQIGGRVVHVRLLHLHVKQAYGRVELDVQHLGALAHHLAVHLTLCGHVDHDVAENRRRAAQAVPFGQRTLALIRALCLARRRQVVHSRCHAVLGEFTHTLQHLAAAADTAAAAHGIDVHAEHTRRVQKRRAVGEAPAPPRRGEDDERLFHFVQQAGAGGCAGGSIGRLRPPATASPGAGPRIRHGDAVVWAAHPPHPPVAPHDTFESRPGSRGRDPSSRRRRARPA